MTFKFHAVVGEISKDNFRHPCNQPYDRFYLALKGYNERKFKMAKTYFEKECRSVAKYWSFWPSIAGQTESQSPNGFERLKKEGF